MSLNDNCHSIDSFIKSFNGGTRTNRFRVIGEIGRNNGTRRTAVTSVIPLPPRGKKKEKKEEESSRFTAFHVRTASLPEAILGNIPINYRGRTVNYPGDRMYKPWEITILDDTGTNSLYKAFHDWHNLINNHDTNEAIKTDPGSHFASDWTVQQFDPNGAKVIREFFLKNCWPIGVGQLPLSMNEDNQLGAFSVTILFSHYTYKQY